MKKSILSVRELCTVGIITALNAVLAQIAIPLPFTPIPFSLGMMAVFIAGILLAPLPALFSQLCYLLLGIVGLPVFGNFTGGLGVFLGPKGGYLMAYPLMALVISLAVRWGKQSGAIRVVRTAVAMVLSTFLLLYLLGTLWLCFVMQTGFVEGLAMAVFPFIPLDMVKIAFCAAVMLPLRDRLAKQGLLGSKTV
ncbi:MAG: biotin transporter BioY [Oscillospiraceae bacterium]